MDLTEIDLQDVKWFDMAQDKVELTGPYSDSCKDSRSWVCFHCQVKYRDIEVFCWVLMTEPFSITYLCPCVFISSVSIDGFTFLFHTNDRNK